LAQGLILAALRNIPRKVENWLQRNGRVVRGHVDKTQTSFFIATARQRTVTYICRRFIPNTDFPVVIACMY